MRSGMKPTLTSGKVLQHYYAQREKRGIKPPEYFRKKNWEHAQKFLDWAVEQKITDPLRFIDYLFEVGDFNQRVPFLNRLCSAKLVAIYLSEWQQGERDAADGYDRLVRRAGTKQEQTVKALRILTPGMEAAKVHYVRREELCQAESEVTGGFHPESQFCPTCPQAVRCAAQLYRRYGFDVVALRAGRLYDLPKEVARAAIS